MKRKKVYSDKQRELLKVWQKGGLKRINLLEGSVRSGKTWISLVLWLFLVSAGPKDGCYLMAAKTVGTLRRNCLDLLTDLAGKENFTYSLARKEGLLMGRRIYLEGAGDNRAENKIRGMTLSGAYCDELTLFPEGFFAMLLSRLSAPDARLIATTNPDCPEHWLMKHYLNRRDELDLLTEKFLLEDNPFLEPSYIRNLKKEYTGVFYQRYILGEWVRAEGLVYPMFDEAAHVSAELPEQARWYISIDYGTTNPCSMGLWAVAEGKAYRTAEYYYDSRADRNRGRQKTDEEYYQALEQLAGTHEIELVVADPSAASFLECIRRHRRFRVRKADNAVLDGIRYVSTLLGMKRLMFHPDCTDALREFREYSWDETGGGEKPLKEHDHAMDDIRYFCMTVLKRDAEFRNFRREEDS